MIKLTITSSTGTTTLVVDNSYSIAVEELNDTHASTITTNDTINVEDKEQPKNTSKKNGRKTRWDAAQQKYLEYIRNGGNLKFRDWQRQYKPNNETKDMHAEWISYVRAGGTQTFPEYCKNH